MRRWPSLPELYSNFPSLLRINNVSKDLRAVSSVAALVLACLNACLLDDRDESVKCPAYKYISDFEVILGRGCLCDAPCLLGGHCATPIRSAHHSERKEQ